MSLARALLAELEADPAALAEVRRLLGPPVAVYAPQTLAAELGITARAVRAAIERGDLEARRSGRGYVIGAEAVAALGWRKRQPNGAARIHRRPIGIYGAVLSLDPCSYCGAPSEHVDHIVALSCRGEDEWTNYTAACKTCNWSKSARPVLVRMAER